MPKVKRGKNALKKRKRILKHVKGFRWSRKSKERAAREALLHAWTHAFRGRKTKKRDNRAEWNVQINAAARESGTKYSTLIRALKLKKVTLDRKILSALARTKPEIFKKITEFVNS